MSASKIAALLLAALPVAFGAGVSAHRRDEYLMAARIGIEPDRIHLELALTPGIAVADGVIRDIDVNRDGVLSANEQQAYARRVIGVMTLHVDEAKALHLEVAASSFPERAAMRNGEGRITIESDVAVPNLPAGRHRLVFRNRDTGKHTVFLANALAPADDRVAVTGQQRDKYQRQLTIDFVVR